MRLKAILQVIVFFLSPVILYAQVNGDSMIQFSGVVISTDSLTPIPYVNIKILGTTRNVVSDSKGLFSLNVFRGNDLTFSCLGYKTAYFKIPDTISKDHYVILQRMQPDTLVLSETSILPWQTYEQFKTAFVSTEVNKKEMDNARKNINQIQNTLFRAYLPIDPYSNYKTERSNWWWKARTKGEMTVPISIGFGIPLSF